MQILRTIATTDKINGLRVDHDVKLKTLAFKSLAPDSLEYVRRSHG